MRDDTQLTQEERYQIEALLKMGHCQSGIADALNRDKSTISREVSRSPVLVTLAERRTRYRIIAKAPDKSAQAVTDALLTALQPMPTLSTRSPMTTARSSPAIRPSPRDSTPKATSPTPTIPGSADSTRTPTGSSVSTCPRAPISGLSHLRRSAASWTNSTTGHGNVLASRLQISYS